MNNLLFITVSLFVFACKSPSINKEKKVNKVTNTSYQWEKILDSAQWNKSYNYQLFTHRDTLWVFHPQGCWYSVNGKDWALSSLPNAIHNLAFLDYVQFNGAMYGLGNFEGNIEKFTFSPVIYRSSNMRNWEIVERESNLPARFFYHPFVFNNKIWIVGGEDKNTQHADIWNSSDGINWIKQKDNLPFGKRSNSQIVNLNNKLYLLNNDVWSSTDAINWKLVTNEIAPGSTIFGYNAVVYYNKIWLLGCNRNGQFSSQVLASSDGKSWEKQDAPWSPRGGIAAAVFQNKIYMTGGKYGGTPDHTEFIYSNDLWTLIKK